MNDVKYVYDSLGQISDATMENLISEFESETETIAKKVIDLVKDGYDRVHLEMFVKSLIDKQIMFQFLSAESSSIAMSACEEQVYEEG